MGDGETALLDNSAAKHKMAVRPQRKRRSESRNRDSIQDITSSTEMESSVTVEQQCKKVKSETSTEQVSSTETDKAGRQQTYRRTRSGRQMVSDPVAKRE